MVNFSNAFWTILYSSILVFALLFLMGWGLWGGEVCRFCVLAS